MKGVSLFSGAGIGEFFFDRLNIEIKVANELVPKRSQLYKYFYPDTNMIQGDITNKEIFEKINSEIKKEKCNFLIATPPCQGLSTLGKKEYVTDERNYLFLYVLKIIDNHDFDYIIFENVPKFIEVKFLYKNKKLTIPEILSMEFADDYVIISDILNAKDFGVPQSRPRSFVKMYKKDWYGKSQFLKK